MTPHFLSSSDHTLQTDSWTWFFPQVQGTSQPGSRQGLPGRLLRHLAQPGMATSTRLRLFQLQSLIPLMGPSSIAYNSGSDDVLDPSHPEAGGTFRNWPRQSSGGQTPSEISQRAPVLATGWLLVLGMNYSTAWETDCNPEIKSLSKTCMGQ